MGQSKIKLGLGFTSIEKNTTSQGKIQGKPGHEFDTIHYLAQACCQAKPQLQLQLSWAGFALLPSSVQVQYQFSPI